MDFSNYKIIFHFLEAPDILRCSQVCHKWKQFAQSDEIWIEQTRRRSYAYCGYYKEVDVVDQNVETLPFCDYEDLAICKELHYFRYYFPISGFVECSK